MLQVVTKANGPMWSAISRVASAQSPSCSTRPVRANSRSVQSIVPTVVPDTNAVSAISCGVICACVRASRNAIMPISAVRERASGAWARRRNSSSDNGTSPTGSSRWTVGRKRTGCSPARASRRDCSVSAWLVPMAERRPAPVMTIIWCGVGRCNRPWCRAKRKWPCLLRDC